MENEFENDSKTSRCTGLLRRVAIRKSDNAKISIGYATKAESPYYCPSCLSDAIPRKCTEKVDHFFHKAKETPIIRKKDTDLHNSCRDELLEFFKKIFPNGNWEKERTIPANFNGKKNKEIRPDISGRIDNKGIAIEIQASAYTVDRIMKKTLEYSKLGIYVLWIVPLREELDGEPFRPRLFEKYLHSLYYGRVYYYNIGSNTNVRPVHYSPAKRYIDESSWFNEDGEEEYAGGFYLTYRTIKKPNFGDWVDMTKDFTPTNNKGFKPKNVKKEVPNCLIFQDNLKKWWSSDEFKNVETQHEIIKKRILEDYDIEDDYDEYEEN